MGRSKKTYTINVHYPKNEEELLCMRKSMGEAYIKFVKDYILALPVTDEQKNQLYSKVLAGLNKC